MSLAPPPVKTPPPSARDGAIVVDGPTYVPSSARQGAAAAPAASGSIAGLEALVAMIFNGVAEGDVADLIKRLRHYNAVAVGAPTIGFITLAPNVAQLLVPANPKRLVLSYQLPTGITAFEGYTLATAVPGGNSGVPGYQLPVGGGWTYGPEYLGAVYVVSASTCQVTFKELSSDVPYP